MNHEFWVPQGWVCLPLLPDESQRIITYRRREREGVGARSFSDRISPFGQGFHGRPVTSATVVTSTSPLGKPKKNEMRRD